MDDNHYDVIVLGGGTAGSNAARTAGSMGKKVLMVFKPDLQNLCIEKGCMPSKSMLAAAELMLHTRHSDKFGITIKGPVTPQFQFIQDRKNIHVGRFMKALREKVASDPYETIEGTARFLPDDGGIEVTNGKKTKTYYGERYVIATGTKPFIPPVTGLDTVPYLTSDDIMDGVLTDLPKSIAIMGGGAIGLEFATFFNSLGVSVSVIERAPLLNRSDPEFGVELTKMLTDQGIQILAPANVVQAEKGGAGVVLSIEQDGSTFTHEAQYLLVATGRTPQLDELDVENIGLTIEHGGLQACDEHQCTSNDRVYAAGDVTRQLPILHAAAEEGKVAGYNAAVGSNEKRVDHKKLKMLVMFTDPPFAHVGMSEQDAHDASIPVVTHTIQFPETGRAIVMGVEHGLWKLVVHKESGRILGSTAIGPRVDDLLHQVHIAMVLDADVRTLAKTFAYHPTLSEQFMNLVKATASQVGE